MLAPALALTALAAGCSPGARGSAPPAATARAAAAVARAITPAQAAQVFGHYTAVTATAARTKNAKLELTVLTGVQRAITLAALNGRTVTASKGAAGYHDPVFYLPEPAGYPRIFVARATQAAPGLPGGLRANPVLGGTEQPLDRTVLLLFEQTGSGAPWLLASAAGLAPGQSLPRLATDSSGHIPVVKPAAPLAAPLGSVGALQAAAADDGPASAAMKVVNAGPLTTGIYEGARNHADGLRAPAGDIYQWRLAGSGDPVFALRTAAGGALTFYTMTMTETVAVPDIINQADPVRSGPPIQIPQDLAALLPKDQQAPLQELQSEQQLSFTAVDPGKTTAKISVIAIGGGLISASAT